MINTTGRSVQDVLDTEYFLFVYVDGRKFTLTTSPHKHRRDGEGNYIRTPFSDKEEREIFVNFSKVFSGLVLQPIQTAKMERKPQGILQQIERLVKRLLSVPKRFYRSFWREHHDQDMSNGLPETSARSSVRHRMPGVVVRCLH